MHVEPVFSNLAQERKQIPPQSEQDRLLLQITATSPLRSRFICNAKAADCFGNSSEHTPLCHLRSMSVFQQVAERQSVDSEERGNDHGGCVELTRHAHYLTPEISRGLVILTKHFI